MEEKLDQVIKLLKEIDMEGEHKLSYRDFIVALTRGDVREKLASDKFVVHILELHKRLIRRDFRMNNELRNRGFKCYCQYLSELKEGEKPKEISLEEMQMRLLTEYAWDGPWQTDTKAAARSMMKTEGRKFSDKSKPVYLAKIKEEKLQYVNSFANARSSARPVSGQSDDVAKQKAPPSSTLGAALAPVRKAPPQVLAAAFRAAPLELNSGIKEFKLENHYIPRSRNADLIKELNSLLKQQIIEKSHDVCGISPIQIVSKADGRIRLVMDLRHLNMFIKPVKYDLPRIEQLIAKVPTGYYYAKVDLKNAFWSIALKEEVRKWFGFSFLGETFRWRCLPFGLKSAPSIFQHFIDAILRRVSGENWLAYIDDILVWGKDQSQVYGKLKEILKVLEEAGLELNRDKSCLNAVREIKYCGWKIGNNKETISSRNLQKPKDAEDLRRKLGVLSWLANSRPKLRENLKRYWHRIKRFAGIKDSEWQQTRELASEAGAYVTPGKELTVRTDCNGIDAVVYIQAEDKVIDLQKVEVKMPVSTTEGELVGLAQALRKIVKRNPWVGERRMKIYLDNEAAVKILGSLKERTYPDIKKLRKIMEDPTRNLECRALEFLRRFDLDPIWIERSKNRWTDEVARIYADDHG